METEGLKNMEVGLQVRVQATGNRLPDTKDWHPEMPKNTLHLQQQHLHFGLLLRYDLLYPPCCPPRSKRMTKYTE